MNTHQKYRYTLAALAAIMYGGALVVMIEKAPVIIAALIVGTICLGGSFEAAANEQTARAEARRHHPTARRPR